MNAWLLKLKCKVYNQECVKTDDNVSMIRLIIDRVGVNGAHFLTLYYLPKLLLCIGKYLKLSKHIFCSVSYCQQRYLNFLSQQFLVFFLRK